MKSTDFSSFFLESVLKKYPKKSDCAQEIANILDIDKMSVYRRLRGEIKFTMDEMALIASKLNISLDKIMDESSLRPYKMTMFNLPALSYVRKLDLEFINHLIPRFESFSKEKNTEMGSAMNVFPKQFLSPYKYLTRFILFKTGHYLFNNYDCFDSVVIMNELKRFLLKINGCLKEVDYTFYIWDNMIIPNLVRDIKYFESMSLVSASDVKLIKEDMVLFLNDLEDIVTSGAHKITGNKFDLYCSSLNFDTSRTYMSCDSFCLFYVGGLIIRSIYSVDEEYSREMRLYINALKDAAVLISGSAEKERIKFFNYQREAISIL